MIEPWVDGSAITAKGAAHHPSHPMFFPLRTQAVRISDSLCSSHEPSLPVSPPTLDMVAATFCFVMLNALHHGSLWPTRSPHQESAAATSPFWKLAAAAACLAANHHGSRSSDHGWNIMRAALLKFETATPPTESRCQYWKSQVSPGAAETKPVGCGMFIGLTNVT